MTLQELHDYITRVYECGWQDAIEGRPFNPQIPQYLERIDDGKADPERDCA